MELDLAVGSMITTRPDEDRSVYEEERESVAQVQDQLREEGITIDLLAQPGTEVWESGIETMGALYQLSRLAAHLERDEDVSDILADGPVIYEELDAMVTDVWDDLATTRFPHLINLQGINSYYLPVDFAQPVWLAFENEDGEEDSAFFGSSIALQRELVEVDGLLRNANVPAQSEAVKCLEVLREAAQQSIDSDLPIIVW
jgi:hypothetical protein